MKPDNDYDYTSSGFDGFLSRSIDDLSQINLASTGPQTTQIRYDSAQVSGMLGDTLTLGNVEITQNSISLKDLDNKRFFLGDDGK